MSAGVAPPARSSRRPVACGRLRELSPRAIEDQAVVPVGRLRQAEQRLQQPMDAGRPEQVLAPHHLGHALQGVVDHHREVIAGRRLLARQDDVAPGLRPGGHRAGLAIGTFAVLDPAEIAGARAGRRHVEPQRVRRARFEQPRALVRRQRFRRAGIERRAVGIARPRRLRLALRHQFCDLGAALETRIDQPLGGELLERIAIVGKMLRLPPHRGFPGDAEPGEVLDRSRPRIPACSAWRRYPRCAAGTGRRPARARSKFSSAE